MKKLLIVYYSWSHGNTEGIAKQLQAATGADILRLETAVPYPADYDAVVRQGQEEVKRGAQPELKPLALRPEDYDGIAVGTPTWWYTMAPAVRTFLSGRDWAGKTVIPFVTHGGWPGRAVRDMEALCPGADVRHPMEVRFDSSGGSRMETAQGRIDDWIGRVKQELLR